MFAHGDLCPRSLLPKIPRPGDQQTVGRIGDLSEGSGWKPTEIPLGVPVRSSTRVPTRSGRGKTSDLSTLGIGPSRNSFKCVSQSPSRTRWETGPGWPESRDQTVKVPSPKARQTVCPRRRRRPATSTPSSAGPSGARPARPCRRGGSGTRLVTRRRPASGGESSGAAGDSTAGADVGPCGRIVDYGETGPAGGRTRRRGSPPRRSTTSCARRRCPPPGHSGHVHARVGDVPGGGRGEGSGSR